MNPKIILRIARWEVEHQYSGVTFKQLISVILLVVFASSLFIFGGIDSNTNSELYSVGIVPNTSYEEAVEQSDSLEPVDVSDQTTEEVRQSLVDGSLDAVATKDRVEYYSKRDISVATASILDKSLRDYNRQILENQGEQSVAYPVLVELNFSDSGASSIIGENNLGNSNNDNSSDSDNEDNSGNSNNDDSSDSDNEENSGNSDNDDSSDSDNEENSGNSDNDDSSDNNDTGNSSGEQPENSNVSESGDRLTPESINPPFPLDSVVLAFIFLIPMNFVVQSYASSIFDERIDYSGELLLVSPAGKYDIILGKTLPYFFSLILFSIVASLFIGTSLVTVFSVAVISIAFLASAFLTGVFVRSYRELSFIFLIQSLFIFGFVLIPSVFTGIDAISIISPLTLVVMDLQNESITIGDILFSTGPLLISGLIIFYLSSGLYREEDLFTQRRIRRKIVDMFSVRVNSSWSFGLFGMLVLPFVFATQLLFVSLLFVLPEEVALLSILVIAAFTEEVAKSFPVYSGMVTDKIGGKKSVIVSAVASGLGFFVAEQFTTVAQLVGLLDISVGDAIVNGILAELSLTGTSIIVPFLWIGIHPITTSISSYAATRGRSGYIIGIILATAVHLAYNLGVIAYA